MKESLLKSVADATEVLEKALDKSKLVPVTVQVTRKGKVFNKVVWKKASEVEAEKNKSKQMTLPKDEKPAKAQPKHDITITKDSDGVYSYTSKGEDMGLKFKSKNDLISHLADTHSHVDLPSIKSLVDDADKKGSSSTEFDTPTLRYDSDKKDFKKVQIKTTGTIKKNADGTFTFSDGAEGMDITEDSKDDLIRRMVESDRTDLATAKELVNGLKNSDTSSKTYTSTAIEFEDKQQASTDVKESSEVEKQTLDINKFDSLKKTNRPAALEYLKDCGVTWEENPHPAINLMRATMAAKGLSTNPAKNPSKENSKPIPNQLQKPKETKKAPEGDKQAKNQAYLQGLKDKGITWEENAHPAINLMRAKMAEKKAGTTQQPDKATEDKPVDKQEEKGANLKNRRAIREELSKNQDKYLKLEESMSPEEVKKVMADDIRSGGNHVSDRTTESVVDSYYKDHVLRHKSKQEPKNPSEKDKKYSAEEYSNSLKASGLNYDDFWSKPAEGTEIYVKKDGYDEMSVTLKNGKPDNISLSVETNLPGGARRYDFVDNEGNYGGSPNSNFIKSRTSDEYLDTLKKYEDRDYHLNRMTKIVDANPRVTLEKRTSIDVEEKNSIVYRNNCKLKFDPSMSPDEVIDVLNKLKF